MPDWLGIVLTVALLAANAFFVAAEFALVSARRSVLEPQVGAGVRGARITVRAMENVSLMMAGAQLGITVCSLALGVLSEPAIAHLIEPGFEALGIPEGAVHPIAFAIALALVTLLHVVLGEMVPKNVALAGPERAALVLTAPLVAVVRALRPLIWLLNVTANGVLRVVGVEPRYEVASAFTRDEVAGMVAESHRGGLLDADEHDLLTDAIGFVQLDAGAVLLPVDEVRTVRSGVTPDEVEALAVDSGHSRFPLADFSGYLHVKDVLALAEGDQPVRADLVRPLPAVAPDASLRAVLQTMRASGVHLVRAAEGERVLGVVAMADVVGQLIGAARDPRFESS